MADDERKLPPKLDLRKQGVLKSEAAADNATPPESAPEAPAAAAADAPAKPQDTHRLTVPPAAEDLPAGETGAATDAGAEGTAEAPAKPGAAASTKPVRPLILKKTPDEPSARTADPSSGDEARKHETSRIPLERAKPPADNEEPRPVGVAQPKTIKIKPAQPAPRTGAGGRLTHTAPIDVEPDADAKRQTSRIPLESALAADTAEPGETAAAEEEAGRPKTIKIKRPSPDAGSVRIRDAAPVDEKKPRMGETTRLDDAAVTPGPSATQKKTIRVKRASEAPTVRAKSAAKPEEGPAPSILHAPPAEPAVDEFGWFTLVTSIAAVLVTGVMVWMLCAQALGPDVSLTRLSYAQTAPDLPWPGKVAPSQ